MPVGRDEWDVLAGALRSPSGSLRSGASSRTEPVLKVSDRDERVTLPTKHTWHLYCFFVVENPHVPSGGTCLLGSTPAICLRLEEGPPFPPLDSAFYIPSHGAKTPRCECERWRS